MLQAHYNGPATSPGSLLYSRQHASSFSSSSRSNPYKSPSGRLQRSVRRVPPGDTQGQQGYDEELAWFNKTVVWSRGSQIYRQYTFENENVQCAAFFNLPTLPSDPSSSTSPVKKLDDPTFGPFHMSQYAEWGGPRAASSSSSSKRIDPPRTTQALIIFLQSHSIIYLPSGETITQNLPFLVQSAHPLATGLLIQRKLEPRELGSQTSKSRYNILDGIHNDDRTSASILDDLDIRDILGNGDEGEDVEMPRFYTLESGFEELKPVVEGSTSLPIGPEVELLHVCEEPYPYVVGYDGRRKEVIFWKKTRVPNVQDTPLPNLTAMRPDELLRQPLQQATKVGGASKRPSLHRAPSTFSAATAERRASGAADPLDRTQRRGPRVSRNMTEPGGLQAALDPQPQPFNPPRIPITRNRGVSSASIMPEREKDRRLSEASFMRDDPLDAAGAGKVGMGLGDLRETTMMMGLERQEGAVRSEMVLERVWSWKPPEPIEASAIQVFLSENVSVTQVQINLLITPRSLRPTLYAFQATHLTFPTLRHSIQPLHHIPCISAAPIISTRHSVYDVLLLHPDHMFSIYTSGNRSIPVTLPKIAPDGLNELPLKLASSLTMEMDKDDSMGDGQDRAVGFRDRIESKVTVISQNGAESCIDFDFRIPEGLTRRCFEALSQALPARSFFELKKELLLRYQSLRVVQNGDEDTTWSTFADTVKHQLGFSLQDTTDSVDDQLLRDAQRSGDSTTGRLAALVRGRRSEFTQVGQRLPGVRSGGLEGGSDAGGVIMALHLVGQNCRLSSSGSRDLDRVGGLVMDIAGRTGRSDWWDYWKRILPSIKETQVDGGKRYLWCTAYIEAFLDHATECDTTILDRFDEPPDILAYLTRRLLTKTSPFPTPASICTTSSPLELGNVQPCRQTSLICETYDSLGVLSTVDSWSMVEQMSARTEATVRLMASRRLGADWIADLPCGIAVPIMEVLRVCQANPGIGWTPEMYTLVERKDSAVQASGDSVPGVESTAELESEEPPTVGDVMASVTITGKGEMAQPPMPHVRFGSDRRLAEVERIMQTTKARTVSAATSPNASDQEIQQQQQSMVNLIATRTLSIPIGQGIFEFGTRNTKITNTWEIPLIELAVKVVPGNLQTPAQVTPEIYEWPCFHNGVSAALSISPDCKGIDSSWILFNRPNQLNPEHGGFLLGLGITGHLRNLKTYHAFPYMEPRHDYTSIGLLLGLACSHAGSGDLLLTKVLSLHTHALLPLGSMELNASPLIQSAALVGLGLVYVGSKNIRMAEAALAEVGRREMQGVEGFGEYIEAYSFAASAAFGLIMLGRGGLQSSEVDRRMLAQLKRCISGDAQLDGPKGMTDTTLTAPGATLGLGLMYLKTNRRDIADMLEIPQSAFALEHVRPDLLLLRTFSRALILWESTAPTMEWIESQLPDFIRQSHNGHKKTSTMELNTELAYFNIVAGACFAIGVKYAGTAAEVAYDNLFIFHGVLNKAASSHSQTYEGRIRRTAARQGLNVIILAIAAIMSGTGELRVLRRFRIAHGQEGAGITSGTHMALHMAIGLLFCGRGHYTLGNSNLAIAAMAISFFPRFAPTTSDNKAYPQAFRHLWALAVEPRCLVTRDVDTGKTIYLPIKIKTRDPSGVVRSNGLISPTLVAPFDTIVSIEVDSPRYWPITYDLALPSHRQALVQTRTIYVKRKAGYLEYNDDPKGNRSIFVRAGSMTGFDLHYDLISPAAPPTISPEEVLELVRAHSGDPTLVGLAELFGGVDERVDKFVQTVLLECISMDKVGVFGVYLGMYLRLVRGGEGVVGMLGQVGMMRSFYAPGVWDVNYTAGVGGERKLALIRSSFLGTIAKRLGAGGEEERGVTARKGYWNEGSWLGDDVGLAVYLARNNVPPRRILEVLRQKVRDGEAMDEGVLEMRVREVAGRYVDAVSSGRDTEDGSGVRRKRVLWKLNSLQEAIRTWLDEA